MATTTDMGRVRELSSGVYTAQLLDENGDPMPGASLSTLQLTLYVKDTGDVINSRNAQNVLNTNGVTVDSSGNLTWTVQPADHAVTANRKVERHRAVFDFTWSSGTKRDWHAVEFVVVADPKVS